ncbi:glutamate-5-semialdehyde dehydrogenase [Hyphococcus flavus]|uniref:Gamma-glutamyl phosphate reductase n=1 Tax=Hyphococcus flavus TaxID=1866326 RepID=A0AAF0CGM7_9PROT|nr:glutamate-5-semialdehyde dehydrogenase [Hyphococcus flavus]WDI30852.1 glutamate-5-semialdehyde dehydrogenase [Hyphococcus flavus]
MTEAFSAYSSLTAYMNAIGVRAKGAARAMASAPGSKKNEALKLAAASIRDRSDQILDINANELAVAKEKNVTDAFLDRMMLNGDRIEGIANTLEDVAALDDPVGKVISKWTRPNGLEIERVRTPIGVMAVIYESRPNVTVDAAAIAVKGGNAVILRGGSECIETNKALFGCFSGALVKAGLSENAVQFVETPDRDAVGALLSGIDGNVDLVIPRGGKSLVARVQSDARVPVLSHLDGICHVYVDRDTDPRKAVDIVVNSKMRRTGVCGAAETLLIDAAIANEIWPAIAQALRDKGCEIRGDANIRKLDASVAAASEEDWRTEYLAPILSVAVVDGVTGAIGHIANYSSGHTESIVTENFVTAETFINGVDSAIVLHNASTQFADGGEFGLGAEIGIATGRLHARGPVGVEELTTYKNVVRGTGQIRP